MYSVDNKISDEVLWKIHNLYYSDDPEKVEYAEKWLTQLVREKTAQANLFLLSLYKYYENVQYMDKYGNYWCTRYKTEPIAFGKSYKYVFKWTLIFDNKYLIQDEDYHRDYGRYQVGSEQPDFDFQNLIFEKIRGLGYEVYTGLFHSKTKENQDV